jgi:pyridoxal phosphate enzyme (YggS family)
METRVDSRIKVLLADRLRVVEEKIAAACSRARRSRTDVTMVAVTKTVSAAVAALLPQLGVLDLGESRPQELWRKAAALPSGVRWHLVGHLQRNKVDRTLPLVSVIHSVDSLRLLQVLEQQTEKLGNRTSVLLEVKASGEPNKSGFEVGELPGVISQLGAIRHVRVVGLMTMAALTPNPEECRPTFRTLRELRNRLRANVRPPHELMHLSMGMTNDFEIAIEEGATLLRIGTALLEGIAEVRA